MVGHGVRHERDGRTPARRPRLVGPWPPSRRFVLTSAAALGVALVPLLFVVLSSGGSPSQNTAGSVTTPSSVPQVTVTATVSATPSPGPAAVRDQRVPSPTRSPSPSRSASATPSPTPAPAHPPGSDYAQVVNLASARAWTSGTV